MSTVPGKVDYAALHAADKASYRKRAGGSLHRLERPLPDGSTHSGTLRLPDGSVWVLEARVVERAGRKHFEIVPYAAARELLRGAKVSGDPSTIPPDLVALMDAPFGDPLPPMESGAAKEAVA
jgi:hypothetical protein